MIIDNSACFIHKVIYHNNIKLDLLLYCIILNMEKEFFNYYDRRKDQKENVGRSFTHGSALHDFLKSSIRVHDYYTIRDMIERSVEQQYELKPGTTENFSYNALLELCDISALDEIANYLFFNEEENEDIH